MRKLDVGMDRDRDKEQEEELDVTAKLREEELDNGDRDLEAATELR